VVALVGQPTAGHQLVEHHAHRVDVGPSIDGFQIADLLGRHVRRRAGHHAGARDRAAVAFGNVSDSEIEDHDVTRVSVALDEEDVLELEVAVNDAAIVRGEQAVADLREDRQDVVLRHRAAVRCGERRERPAIEVVHHDVPLAIGQLRASRDANDIAVRDRRSRTAFVHEPLHHQLVVRNVGEEQFHDVLRIEHAVPREVQHAHSTLRELAGDRQLPDRGPDCQHVRSSRTPALPDQ